MKSKGVIFGPKNARVLRFRLDEITRLWPRFWGHVDRSGGGEACWNWTRSTIGRMKYGQAVISRKLYSTAHRVAWTLTRGPIPQGINILHSCDNPPCCNPRHLFMGTVLDNHKDSVIKGRAYCIKSRKLTEEQVRHLRSTGMSDREVMSAYKISPRAAYLVRKGMTYKWVSQ